MAEDERATGTPNTIYDLSSVLFHALKGGALYERYIRDAEEAGDQELADFFRRVRDEDGMRADEAQLLLAERTPTAARRSEGASTPTAEGAAGASSRTEPASSASPREGDAPPRRTEGAPPRPGPSADLPGTEPIAEGAPLGDVRRETAVTWAPEDLASRGDEVSPDVPRTVDASPRGEEVPPSRTEAISTSPVPRGGPPRRTEEVPPSASLGTP